eukprot:6187094-Pleurochrysis_carterae.AAC.2
MHMHTLAHAHAHARTCTCTRSPALIRARAAACTYYVCGFGSARMGCAAAFARVTLYAPTHGYSRAHAHASR